MQRKVVYPDKTSLTRLDEHIACAIRKFVGLRNLKEIIDERQCKFRRKIKSSTVIQAQIAYDYLTNFKCMY